MKTKVKLYTLCESFAGTGDYAGEYTDPIALRTVIVLLAEKGIDAVSIHGILKGEVVSGEASIGDILPMILR